jgi:guanylate kinase
VLDLVKKASKPRPFLMVLSAPSGGGKTTVCLAVLKRLPWLKRCVTATTRSPRKGEKQGRDYWFLSEAEFKRRAQSGGFYEWARVHGNYYGTPRKEVAQAMRQGRSLVLVIDVQGGAQVKRKDPKSLLVFLLPPSIQALEKRLKVRGKDSAAVVARRLKDARGELKAARTYDYWVVNDKLSHAVGQVSEIAKAARWRQA